MANSSVLISDYIHYPCLPDQKIKAIAGILLEKGSLGQYREPIEKKLLADLTFESEFIPLEAPFSGRIIKYTKKKHVDNFFKKGQIRLGTFEDYQKSENQQIGDKSEGHCIIITRNDQLTTFAKVTLGNDHFVFSTCDGKMDPNTLNEFKYDAAYEIINPRMFLNSIGKQIKAVSYSRSRCIYKNDKAIVGIPPQNYEYNVIGNNLNSLLSKVQFFVKPRFFLPQKEYRFIWEIDSTIEKPEVIVCKEATKYCRPISI